MLRSSVDISRTPLLGLVPVFEFVEAAVLDAEGRTLLFITTAGERLAFWASKLNSIKRFTFVFMVEQTCLCKHVGEKSCGTLFFSRKF